MLARVVTVSVTRYVRSDGALACCETAVITGRFAACNKRRESVRDYRSDRPRERLFIACCETACNRNEGREAIEAIVRL